MTEWPHSPSHVVEHPGAYILTAATLHKAKLYDSDQKLDLLEEILLSTLDKHGWQVQAWAVFPNHYHFVGLSPDAGLGLTVLTQEIHRNAARDLNRLDGTPGRQCWYRIWDTRISYSKSYLARLNYVHCNAVKHGLVERPEAYNWCSARWFHERASPAFFKTVSSFKIDRVSVYDDF